jgi:predicted chitinase
MTIQARGMEVILEEVEPLPEDGFYKGRGRVSINYLGGAAFAVQFERIYIDEDRNVVTGRIDVVSNRNQMTDVVAWAAEAFKPLTEKLDDLLSKLQAPGKNKEQIATAIDDYIEHVQAFIEKNPQLPDSVQQQLREDALLLETSKGGFLAATDQVSTGMMVATIEQQVRQAKDRIAAIKKQFGNGSNQSGKMIAAGKEGKLIAMISDIVMKEGKVFVYNGASKQMKVKFETKDVAKQKLPYQITILVESSNKTISYPETGYDTLVYNEMKEITLDSIPQRRYTVVYGSGKNEYKTSFIVRKHKLEITKEQLKAIFPKTNDKRLEEVVKTINANSSTFDIGTPERMAHFIGQIGAETGGLNDLKESALYAPRNVAKTFPYAQYGHLFEIAVLDSTTCKYNYSPINYDENSCNGKLIARGGTVFPYKNSSEIMNAYASTKTDTLIVNLNNKKTRILVYKNRSDVTSDNLTDVIKDKEFNSGLLRVKNCYIRSLSLFDVTYACRMGNGSIASKDGSTFLGKGFIHITGKGGYKDVSVEWNKLYPNDKKEFHGKDITLLETNVEVAIKASMVYWKIKNLNQMADKGDDQGSIDNVGRIVNGSGKGLPNGHLERRAYTKLAFKNIKYNMK